MGRRDTRDGSLLPHEGLDKCTEWLDKMELSVEPPSNTLYVPSFMPVLQAGLPYLSFPVYMYLVLTGCAALHNMFVPRPSFLGKASKEGFSADREGPPVGLATGCGCTAGITLVAE